jgi:hypothetical protein
VFASFATKTWFHFKNIKINWIGVC